MAGGRRRNAPAPCKPAEVENASVKEGIGEDCVIVLDDSSLESEVSKLRERWELASVLNFLSVFEPMIGSDLKLTAEEIEEGLVKPNNSISQLHISLLKGIPPVSKTLNSSDMWVTVLCKKLAMWWPWVAEGEMPLTALNGQEISRYKELNPTNRLLLLKALCELRAEQDDMVSYINDSLKSGTQISCFRKDKIGADGKGTSYWYDGNAITGYRLYRDIKKTESKTRLKGKAYLALPASCFQWETLATNLEEFQKVVDGLSSSKVPAEIAVGKSIETDAIPAVEKFQKKKQRALKRKQRQEMLLNGFRSSCSVGVTRSCRNRRPISYTFDEYDRVIDEAIQLTKKSMTMEEQRCEHKNVRPEKIASNGDLAVGTDPKDSFGREGDSTDSDTESDRLQAVNYNDDDDNDYDDRLQETVNDSDDDGDYDGKQDYESNNGSDSVDSYEKKESLGNRNNSKLLVQKPMGSRWSERLAGVTSRPDVETRNLGTKNRLRQRPTRNSALDFVVPDSDDENSAKRTNSGKSGHENLSSTADSEDSRIMVSESYMDES